MDPDLSQVPPPEDIVEPTPAPVAEPVLEPIPTPIEEPATTSPQPIEPPPVVSTPVPVESQNEAPQTPTPIFVNPAPAPVPAPFNPHSAERIDYLNNVLRPKAIAVRHAKVAEHLDRLVAHAREKGSIDHKEVRLLLIVGKATATKYLTTLVEQGRLVREEKIGGHHDVRYHAV